MWQGVQAEHDYVFKELANYHPRLLGRSTETLRSLGLSEADCRHAIAHEYGFRRWTEVMHQTQAYDHSFESSVDMLLMGRLKTLKQQLTKKPALVNQKSQYGHKATLLHYAASNGVELWRQRVPLNLPEAVAFLLEAGANPQAKMQVYGGEYTAGELLLSSVHPRKADIFKELQSLLDA